MATLEGMRAAELEEEPDDNYRPPIGKEPPAQPEVAAPPAATTAAEKVEETGPALAEEEAPDEEEEEAAPSAPMLIGHWQQLEGVPRPSAETPRFLAWNGNGHVARYPSEARLEVQYAEEGHLQRHTDSIGLNMAAVSPAACCLAAGAGAGGGSQLLIRPRQQWDKTVLSASLGSADEAVEAVACGDTFVAALTSKRLLRIYGLSGLPLGVVSVPGRSKALAARGEHLCVVTAAGAAPEDDDGDEALDFRLLDVGTRSQRAAGRLPLSPGARLRWLGLSAELAPVAVDTLGVARSLLGLGPGSWGPAGGGGGEWTVVAQLAREEEALGGARLWVVDVCLGTFFCAEVGADSLEEPRPPSRDSEGGLFGAAEGALTAQRPAWGQGGAALREVRWEVPLGPVVACGSAAEEALRETLFARHVEDMKAARPTSGLKDALAKASSVSGGWRAKTFQLYGKLVQAEQFERALDVARHLLAPAGGSNMLNLAQSFAEKAGCHKLADEIAALPRTVAVAEAAPARAPAGASQGRAVPKVIHRELPPLFEAEGDSVDKSPATPSIGGHRASLPGTPLMSQSSVASRAPAPAAPEQDLSQMSSSGPFPGGAGAPEVVDAGAPPPAPAMEPAMAAPGATANPFARKQRAQPAASRAPHLLRDALGGVGGAAVGGAAAGRARPEGEEPAAKAARVSA